MNTDTDNTCSTESWLVSVTGNGDSVSGTGYTYASGAGTKRFEEGASSGGTAGGDREVTTDGPNTDQWTYTSNRNRMCMISASWAPVDF